MASESPSSFGSQNPFRRKTSTTTPVTADHHTASPTTPSTSATAHTPSSSDFARALSSLGSARTDGAPPPAVTFAKPKPVKKVRVQSPPPSSPESAGAEHTYPKYPLPPRTEDDDTSEEEDLNGDREDPFMNEAPPLPEAALAGVGPDRVDLVQAQQAQQNIAYTGRGPPPNPFQKTLEDLERDATEGGQAAAAEQASPAGKTGMDVEAFKRLLLTGQGPALSPGGETGSLAETSSTSRQSISETTNPLQETPRTSHETEPDDDKRGLLTQSTPAPQRSSSRRKKPPPPPATRHGKLIKMELKDKNRSSELEGRPAVGFAATGPSPTSPPTDVNKPLPEPPEDDTARHSIFDKEAAGKLPEVDIDPEADVVPSPRPPTPPNASHSSSTPIQSPPPSTLRKPMPPPRRTGHGRSDSKPQTDHHPPSPEDQATTPPRSSLESQRSRSSSIRVNIAATAAAAPAPPPPRRAAGHRQSPSVSSPVSISATSPSFPFPTSPGGSDEAGSTAAAAAATTAPKVSPPAPPPQRNASLRKSASSASNRSKSGGGGMVPPPPPPRVRGGSKGTTEATGLSRTRSVESVRRGSGVVVPPAPAVAEEQEPGELVDGVDTAASDAAVRAMLADLDALQREVDAARAQAEGGGGG